MRIRQLGILLLVLFAWTAQAQDVNIFVNDTANKPKVPQKATVKFNFGFDARNSFVAGRSARIAGIKFGFEIDYKDRFGFGIYALNNPIILQQVPLLVDSTDVLPAFIDTADVSLNFSYLSTFYERVIYRSKHWEFAVPIHLGIGNVKLDFVDRNGKRHQSVDAAMLLGEVSTVGQFNITRWLGVGGGLGYRFIASNNPQVKEAYNAIIYVAKVKFMLGGLYHTIRDRRKDKKAADEADVHVGRRKG